MKDAAVTGWNITRKFLLERRDDIGISHYEIAKRTGLPQSTVDRSLSGEVIPSVVIYYQILGALELNPYLIPKEIDRNKKNRIFFN